MSHIQLQLVLHFTLISLMWVSSKQLFLQLAKWQKIELKVFFFHLHRHSTEPVFCCFIAFLLFLYSATRPLTIRYTYLLKFFPLHLVRQKMKRKFERGVRYLHSHCPAFILTEICGEIEIGTKWSNSATPD